LPERRAEPGAFIVYKPHLDVLSGNRLGKLSLSHSREFADHVELRFFQNSPSKTFPLSGTNLYIDKYTLKVPVVFLSKPTFFALRFKRYGRICFVDKPLISNKDNQDTCLRASAAVSFDG
jgi:hypothetical protein